MFFNHLNKILFFSICLFTVQVFAEPLKLSKADSRNLEINAVEKAIKKNSPAYISLIIDDLGYHPKNDFRAISLKGQVGYAFLPDTPHAKRLAKLAHQKNKEIILHLPMESTQTSAQEPNVLTRTMDKQSFIKMLEKSLSAIPFISGLNNHMGSVLTMSEIHMTWLMSYLAQTNLFFIDSRTTRETIAEKIAQQHHIPNSRRNVFLDHVHTREAIEKQYQRLIRLARKKGTALAIGHPFSMTLDFLEEKLPELEEKNIQLISVKKLISIQNSAKENLVFPTKLTKNSR